jgi:uncharacterized membrane protein
MNGAHFHLLVNHFPIIVPIIGLLILLIGLYFKSEAVKRTAYLLFVLGSIFSILAMASGEEAEEVVEDMVEVSHTDIESHEEAAETFAFVSYLLGGISLFGLWSSFKQKSFANIFSIVTIVVALVALFFAQKTGTTGGEIRHSEIREEVAQFSPKMLHESKPVNDYLNLFRSAS